MPELLSLYAAQVGGVVFGEIYFRAYVHRHKKHYENETAMLQTTDLILVKTEDGFKVYAITHFRCESEIGDKNMFQDAVK